MKADVSSGCCIFDIKTKCDAGLAKNRPAKQSVKRCRGEKSRCVRAEVLCGYCVSDIITKCDAELAKNQISKPNSETMP